MGRKWMKYMSISDEKMDNSRAQKIQAYKKIRFFKNNKPLANLGKIAEKLKPSKH